MAHEPLSTLRKVKVFSVHVSVSAVVQDRESVAINNDVSQMSTGSLGCTARMAVQMRPVKNCRGLKGGTVCTVLFSLFLPWFPLNLALHLALFVSL